MRTILLLCLAALPAARVSAETPPMQDAPVHVSNGVMAGAILSHPAPIYPQEAKDQGLSGSVVLHAVIGKNGHIENLSVVSGPTVFEVSALEAVKSWVYRPYLLDGLPTEVDTTITVNFNLGNSVAPPLPGESGSVPAGAGGPQEQASTTGPIGPVRISGGVMAESILTKVNPRYPEDAKAKHISGLVVTRVTIGKDGTIKSVSVVSGPEELRAATLDAVRQWTYRPYELNGQPTEVDTTITVIFSFKQASDPLADPVEYVLAHPPSISGAASKTQTVHLSPADMKDMAILKVPPHYPEEAKRNHIAGAVVLHAIIDKDGDIADLTVVSGPDALRDSTLDAVRQWRYRPYVVNGVPTAVDTDITVHYSFGR